VDPAFVGKLSSVSSLQWTFVCIQTTNRWEFTLEESSPRFNSLLLRWKHCWIWWKFSLWLGLRIQVLKLLEGNKLTAVSYCY